MATLLPTARSLSLDGTKDVRCDEQPGPAMTGHLAQDPALNELVDVLTGRAMGNTQRVLRPVDSDRSGIEPDQVERDHAEHVFQVGLGQPPVAGLTTTGDRDGLADRALHP